MRRRLSALLFRLLPSLLLLVAALPAGAACLPIARVLPGLRLIPVSLPAPSANSVELTYVGHSSFVIRSPEGVTAVTDYNDYVRPSFAPDIVTMNNAHDTHFSNAVDPAVRHILRGWGEQTGERATHDLTERDLRVRNVPTNLRDWAGTRYAGNSIFVFEVADLCIAHLGHLHHKLTEVHLDALGIIDVVLAPVDGSYTLGQQMMSEVLDQLRPSIVIPMHYFGPTTLARFIALLEDRYTLRTSETPTVRLSRSTLPHRQLLVLPGS